MSEISRELDGLLSNFRTTVRRVNIPEIVPPIRFTSKDDIQPFDQCSKSVDEESKLSTTELHQLKAMVKKSSSKGGNIWQEVDKACAKVEEILHEIHQHCDRG